MLVETFSFLYGSQSVADVKIFVNIQEGFALTFHLCLCDKDIFTEDFLHKSLLCEYY